jgi:alpha-D-xyloside xylohydrolase
MHRFRATICNKRQGLAILVIWVCVVLGAGCGHDHEPLETPASKEWLLGGAYSVRIDQRTGDMTLLRGTQELVRVPVSGWQLGTVPRVDPLVNYDPYPLIVPSPLYAPPEGLEWAAPVSVAFTKLSANSVRLELLYTEDARASLIVEHLDSGRFRVRWFPPAQLPVAYFRLRCAAPGEHGYYGLGEYFDDVNHRGKVRAMQIELDPELESLYNEAHVPVPFLIGSGGWGLFVASYSPAVFDVEHEEPGTIQVLVGTGEASTQGLELYLFAAPTGLDVTRHYYEVTGFPKLPPRWALGPIVWRDENRDQSQFEQDLQTMRALDLPATAVWIDRPYATAVNSFDFDPVRFPTPEEMFALARRLGFRVALWHAPYLDSRAAATKALRDEANARGFFPPRVGLLFNSWGRPLDFTNPEARHWWQQLLRRYTELGVAGFKLDYGEDVVVGPSATRNRWLFADGSDERTMHARYQLFYHQTYAEVLPPDGGFLLVRHSTFGGQVFGPVIWPGDLDASFARHRERVTEKGTTYVAVGGLPAAVVAGSGLGPSGFPFFASDTGGYRHSPPDKELFTRWFQHTALSPAMQIGTSTNDVAWEPTALNGFDAEMLDWYRTYTRLHLRLFPYLWTYAQRLQTDGRAIQRPFGLAYPSTGAHPWDQYLLGDHLLVAPVVARGQRERAVFFPPGKWIEWWSGRTYEGPGEQVVPAPLAHAPFFLKQGGIVPLLRPTIDALVETEEPGLVDSYADTPGVLYGRVFPGPEETSFTVFDGTRLSQSFHDHIRQRSVVQLSYTPGTEFRRGAVLELVGLDATVVSSVRIAGVPVPLLETPENLENAAAGWAYQDGKIWVRLPATGGIAEVQLQALP